MINALLFKFHYFDSSYYVWAAAAFLAFFLSLLALLLLTAAVSSVGFSDINYISFLAASFCSSFLGLVSANTSAPLSFVSPNIFASSFITS